MKSAIVAFLGAALVMGLPYLLRTGPEVGEKIPAFQAKDQGGKMQTLETLRLEAIQETVPVYTGTLTASRDVTFAEEKELFSAAGSFRTVLVEGVFRYQACDEKECFRPVVLPLRWTFPVGAHDRVRAPEALQRR